MSEYTPSHASPMNASVNAVVEEDEINLMEYLSAMIEGYRMILASVVVFSSLASAYALLVTPVYKADALIQVEEKSASLGGLSELDSLFGGATTPTEAEIEIILSRSVLGKVVETLQLNVLAKPHYFPVIGAWMARRYKDEGLENAFLGMNDYAWGGEVLRLDSLSVPKETEDKPLSLVAMAEGKYQLFDDDRLLLEGQVGKVSKNKGFSVFISELSAHPGTRFDVVKQRWLTSLKTLKDGLRISEKGKKTGVLLMTLQDSDAQYAIKVLNAIADIYLRQNVEHKSEEAQKALLFLQGQLPEIKIQLDRAEAKLNQFRLDSGSLDVGLEVQSMLQQSVAVEGKLSEAKMQKIELERKFTASHPVLKSLNLQMLRLEGEKETLEQKIKALPETEQEVLRLMRDVKVQTELYTLLLNKAQELKVAKAGTTGNVRILDYAVAPYQPIKPKKSLIIIIGFLLGGFIGVVIIFIRKGLESGVIHPDIIENQLGISVYANIPHTQAQEALFNRMRKATTSAGEGDYLLASRYTTDLAVEALRSLRTNLHFGLMEAKNNIVMISGISPGAGKSFVSANLSHVLSETGTKVLLIDADLRKGHLHDYFNVNERKGLTECIRGDITLDEAITSTGYDNLDVLFRGSLPPNPAELLVSENFKKVLKRVSEQYDLVLIDTPPVLAVTDAVIIGKLVGSTFFLIRSEMNPIAQIQQAIRRLEHGGGVLKGVIFNGMKAQKYAYGKYKYQYEYEYK